MKSKYIDQVYYTVPNNHRTTAWKCITYVNAKGGHKKFLLTDGQFIIIVRDNDMTALSTGEKTMPEILARKYYFRPLDTRRGYYIPGTIV